MTGNIRRTNENGGDTLAWNFAKSGGTDFVSNPLPPRADSKIDGEWTTVAPGDTIDFVLRAPTGDNCGSVAWNLRIMGRENPASKPEEIGNLKDQFPKSDSPPPVIPPADPWTDIIQMLWASNEFHFID